MRPHEPYTPQNRKNVMSFTASGLFAAAVGVMWFMKDRLGLDSSDLFIFTGAAMLIILLSVCDFRKRKKNYLDAVELKKQRDEMKTDDFSDSGIFFK